MKMRVSGTMEGFPSGSDGKASVCNIGDPGSIPGLGRSPGTMERYQSIMEMNSSRGERNRGLW